MDSFIYIIFGASGSGKSTLLHEIRTSDIRHTINTKLTSRPKRDYDEDEIETANEDELEKEEFKYQRYGNIYAININQVEDAINRNLNHFIICNDIETIVKLKERFKAKIKVIFLSFDAPRKTIEEIINRRNLSDDKVNLRIQKIDVLYDEFVSNKKLFDHVVLNKFGAPPSQMMIHLRRILESDTGRSAFGFLNIQDELLEINNKISDLETALVNSNATLSSEKQDDYVFIVMAMVDEDPQLIDVLNTIKRTCNGLGKLAERVDDYIHKNEITDKMLGSIKTAEYVVADLTHSRPNVYYELGYAHAYGKNVILTAKSGTKLHFDVRNYNVLFYTTLTELEQKLTDYMSKYDDENKTGASKV